MNTRSVTCINRAEKGRYANPAWVLCFGAYGWTRLLVYASSLESALDECVDWIADNAPGLLCSDQVTEAFDSYMAENPEASEEEGMEYAGVDMTCAGNAGDYIASWEWCVALENASPKQIADYVHGR